MEQQPDPQPSDALEQEHMFVLNAAFEAYESLSRPGRMAAGLVMDFNKDYVTSYPTIDALREDVALPDEALQIVDNRGWIHVFRR